MPLLLLILLLPFTSSSKTLIFVVLFLDPSGIFSLLHICIKLALERYLIAVLMLILQIRGLQVEVSFAVSSTWRILSVRLPFCLLFRSSWSLDLSSFPSSRVCVRVCVYVSGRSACLVALAYGLCSHLNPPPALPATAAQKRSVCKYVTVCVGVCSLQGCSPWGCQAAVLAMVIAAQQQAAGPGPPSGLPLSGTSCVCGQQSLLPSSCHSL